MSVSKGLQFQGPTSIPAREWRPSSGEVRRFTACSHKVDACGQGQARSNWCSVFVCWANWCSRCKKQNWCSYEHMNMCSYEHVFISSDVVRVFLSRLYRRNSGECSGYRRGGGEFLKPQHGFQCNRKLKQKTIKKGEIKSNIGEKTLNFWRKTCKKTQIILFQEN